jgi:hypothetical protein
MTLIFTQNAWSALLPVPKTLLNRPQHPIAAVVARRKWGHVKSTEISIVSPGETDLARVFEAGPLIALPLAKHKAIPVSQSQLPIFLIRHVFVKRSPALHFITVRD